jgi:putative spermidine/putrescine transport system substrate-binding protein
MKQSLEATNGHYSQFTGDGLMALYGLHADDPATGPADALRGAREMLMRVEQLNRSLKDELPQPLQIGIGIHYSEAIVGAMGPPRSMIITAIGDTVNTTARLESLTKEYGCPLIISRSRCSSSPCRRCLNIPAMKSRSRRTWLKRAGAVALAPYVITARSQETLIVNTQGGEYQELVERVVIQPFEKRFGVKVIHDPTGTASQDYAKIRASRGAPGFDVAGLLTPPEVILGVKEGLLEKLTEREVPNLKHLWDKSWSVIPAGSGAPHTLQYAALVYNKEKLERPRSWADYWEPQKKYGEKVKGHLINYNPANLLSVYALIHAAQLGKGGVDNMEPAWQRLKAQKPYVGVVVTGSAEAVPHFENGQVWISPYWSARSGYYIDRGLPFDMVIPEEGVIGLFDVACIPTGAKNKKLAYEFLNWRLDPAVQREWALAYFSSPTRPGIELPAKFAANQITTKEQIAKTQFPDSDVIGARRKDWTLKWQEIMG